MNAVKGHDQKVGFKEDAIRLDIPFPSLEGITTANGGWRIMVSGPPVVSVAIANKYADHITDSHDDIAVYSPEFFFKGVCWLPRDHRELLALKLVNGPLSQFLSVHICDPTSSLIHRPYPQLFNVAR